MKNLLFFFLLFSLCLPTQASASECMNLHLAYQKQKVGKKFVKQKLNFKNKSKQIDKWLVFWVFMITCFLGLFILIGLLAFQLTWWLSTLGSLAIGLLILLYWFKSDYNFWFGWITGFLMCVVVCVSLGILGFIGWAIFQGNLGAYLFFSTISALFISLILANTNLF